MVAQSVLVVVSCTWHVLMSPNRVIVFQVQRIRLATAMKPPRTPSPHMAAVLPKATAPDKQIQ